MNRKALWVILLCLVVIVVGVGNVSTADTFGDIYNIEGAVMIKSADGRVTKLQQEKDLFYPVKEGDRIEVHQGKTFIVSARKNEGYEIQSNSTGIIRHGKMVKIKGTVTVKKGLPEPLGETPGTVGGFVIRGTGGEGKFVTGQNHEVSAEERSGPSIITESEGNACTSKGKTRKQTELAAMADARRTAAEAAIIYMKSNVRITDVKLKRDLVSAYGKTRVMTLQVLDKNCHQDVSAGYCCKVRIRAEIIHDEKAMLTPSISAIDDPNMPLKVSLWTDKKEYNQGEKINIYIKSNKSFYARVLYKDVHGAMIQLLPNPYRQENHFKGGVVYKLPSGNDRYELQVSLPVGEENIIIYASTTPVGEIDLAADGGVFHVETKDVKMRTRAVNIKAKQNNDVSEIAEFFEGNATVMTR